jgi:hypothetical protein
MFSGRSSLSISTFHPPPKAGRASIPARFPALDHQPVQARRKPVDAAVVPPRVKAFDPVLEDNHCGPLTMTLAGDSANGANARSTDKRFNMCTIDMSRRLNTGCRHPAQPAIHALHRRDEYPRLYGLRTKSAVIPSEAPRVFAFPAVYAGAGRSEGSAVCGMSNRNEQIPRAKPALRMTVRDFFSSLFTQPPVNSRRSGKRARPHSAQRLAFAGTP